MSISDSLESYILISVAVAGTAMATRIRNGTMVQRISTRVFSWKWAAFWPVERRCIIIDQNMARRR